MSDVVDEVDGRRVVATPGDLVAAREARGMSQIDISQRIKLQIRQVAALEEGSWDLLPGRAFARGALRSYGKLVDADVSPLLDSVGMADVSAQLPLGAISTRTGPRTSVAIDSGRRARPMLWVIGGLIAVVGLVFYFGAGPRRGSAAITGRFGGGGAAGRRPVVGRGGRSPYWCDAARWTGRRAGGRRGAESVGRLRGRKYGRRRGRHGRRKADGGCHVRRFDRPGARTPRLPGRRHPSRQVPQVRQAPRVRPAPQRRPARQRRQAPQVQPARQPRPARQRLRRHWPGHRQAPAAPVRPVRPVRRRPRPEAGLARA